MKKAKGEVKTDMEMTQKQLCMQLQPKMAKKEFKQPVLEDYVNKPNPEAEFDEAAGKKDACYIQSESKI